jgi:hypothetical protein
MSDIFMPTLAKKFSKTNGIVTSVGPVSKEQPSCSM